MTLDSVLLKFARDLQHHALDMDRIRRSIVQTACSLSGAQAAYLALLHNAPRLDSLIGTGEGVPDQLSLQAWDSVLQQGLLGHVYHTNRPIAVLDLNRDPRWYIPPRLPYVPRHGSALGLPLSQGRYQFGVLMLVHTQIDFFDDAIQANLHEMLGFATSALANVLEHRAVKNASPSYQALFDHAIVPTLLTDEKYFIMDVNQKACEFLGFVRSALLHIPIQDVNIQPEEARRMRDLREGIEINFRRHIIDAQGRSIPALVRVRQVKLDKQHLLEWVLQDMSAQEALEQLRHDLTSMIYHDLRNPLGTIYAATFKLGELLTGKVDNPAVSRLLQISLTSTRRLQRMIDSLLDIQKLEADGALLNRQTLDVSDLLKDAVQISQPLAHEAHQRVVCDHSGDFPLLEVDSDMLLRVLLNLIENALKYTPEGGQVFVNAYIEMNTLIISVRDTGGGIPVALQGKLFDKYTRGMTQDVPRGLGLGLAFCRLAVEAHGGRIWVESEMGKGSEFLFTLPLNEQNLSSKKLKQTDKFKPSTKPASKG
jgi:NtrC-family two-component system sensor histidine kinase KinB